MKNFFLGFLLSYFIFSCLVIVRESFAVNSGQSETEYSTPGKIADDMNNLFTQKQNKNLVFIAKSTPSLTDFGEGDVVFSTPTLKGWTRIHDDRYYFVLTKF